MSVCQSWPASASPIDRLSVLDDVGQDHDLGNTGLLVAARDVDFELAEARAEVLQLLRGQLLLREAQYTVPAERVQHALEILLRKRLRKIESVDARSKGLSCARDFHFISSYRYLWSG